MSHQTADEMYVTTEAIKLRYGYVTPELPCGGQGGLELRTAVERIRALARLHLHELPLDGEALTMGELRKCPPLSLDA